MTGRTAAIGIVVAAGALVAGYVAVPDDQIPTSSDFSIGSFSGTYNGAVSGGACTSVVNNTFQGREPTTGTHPVLIYTHGAGGTEDQNDALAVIDVAAKRGFVAISADFDDFAQTSQAFDWQANCIYDDSVSGGMANLACARARANCAKGIVAMGHSRGGSIAIHSANEGPKVVAVHTMGNGLFDLEVVLGLLRPPAGNRQLPHSALRIIDGEYELEDNIGFAEFDWRANLNAVTGQNCQPDNDPDMTIRMEGVDECLNASGNGWWAVQDELMADGAADHCWFNTSGCNTIASSEWLTNPPTAPWHLRSSIQWLDDKVSE